MRSTTCVSMMLAVLLCAGPLSAQQETTAPGAAELAGAVAQYQPYLYPGVARDEADAINRDLREAEDEARRAENPEAKQAAWDRRNTAADRLLALLATCPAIFQVTVGEEKTVLPARAIELPSDTGALLLKITTGSGAPQCLTMTYDFSVSYRGGFAVEAAADAETWALVLLKNVPMLETIVQFQINAPGRPGTLLPITVTTPDRGELRITILSDDDGDAVPGMLRLASQFDGREARPGGAIDFAPQFDEQGGYAGPRRANLPGRLAGSYYCVPGKCSTALAPGTWNIVLHRGTEHVPIFDTVTLSPGETVEKTYRPRRWVDMRTQGWYSGDDHVHAQILSDADAENVMTWIRAEDVHLANVVKMGDIYRTWFEQRGFGPDFRVTYGDYILSPGQECPRTHSELGHTLHMNIDHMIRDTDRYYLYDEIFDTVHAQGGLSGYAHVNSGIFFVHRDMTMNIAKEKIDFVEVLQFANLGTDLFYEFLNTGFKVTASSGSDVPWGGSVGEGRVYAYTGPKPFTAEGWFEAVRRGNTFVTNGIMLNFRVDKALPGDEILLKEDHPLSVHAEAWGDPGRMTPVNLEIVSQGEVIKKVDAPEGGKDRLELDFEIPSGNGFWIAARAEGNDGSRAHTTPIYVVREGLRFWKYEAAGGLIDKRLASLDEIEEITTSANERNQAGELEGNRPLKQLALQGPALLERVAESRIYYEALRETLKHEARLREGAAK